MAVRSLRFVLTGEDKSATRALDRVGSKADGLGRRLGGLAKLGGAAAGAGAVAFGASSIRAFAEAEKAQAGLAQAYSKSTKTSDVSLKSLQKYNSALATKTKYDDDAIATGQTVLTQFNLTGDQIKRLTPLLLDYASMTGKDLPEAARDLGKASQGQGKALKGIGLNLKDLKDPTKNLTQLMDGLSKKVGGFSTNEGKTASGQVQILKNRFGELQETVGEQLLPVVSSLVGWLNDKGVPALQSFADGFKNGTGAGGQMHDALVDIKDAAQTAGDVANKTVVPVVKWFADHPDALKGVALGMAAYATATRAAALWSVLIKPAPPLPGGGGKGGLPFLGINGPTAVAAAGLAGIWGVNKYQHDHPKGFTGAATKNNPVTNFLFGKPKKKPTVPKPGGPAASQIDWDMTPHRAAGGPVKAGLSYLVGERGPELITAKRSGYVHSAQKTRSMFNPHARLNTGQVHDDRTLTGLLTGPVSASWSGERRLRSTDLLGRKRGAMAPAGMKDYINYRTPTRQERFRYEDGSYGTRTVVVKVDMSRSKVAKQTTSESRRRSRNGHPMPFGL